MKQAQHWISDGYTYINNGRASYSFKGTSREELQALAAEFTERAKREIRRVCLIEAYLNGETECTPEAIKI
jgi:hypothetical protein